MIIIDGRKIADKIKNRLKKEVEKLKKPPVLAVILVGNDPASMLYIKIKEKRAREIGIDFQKHNFSQNAKEKEIIYLINKLNSDKNIDAIVVQLPLPNQLNTEKIISSINPKKDADSLTKKSEVKPPTVEAVTAIVNYYKINLKEKNIVIVGQGKLVGKPLSKFLEEKKISHAVCNSETKNLGQITKKADIIISATGVPHLVKSNMVKNGVIIVDAGTSVEKPLAEKLKVISQKSKGDKLYVITGDVDFENVQKNASYITPPTGGVGPVTVAKLLENVVKLTKL